MESDYFSVLRGDKMIVYRTSSEVTALREYEKCIAGEEGLIIHVASGIFLETGATKTYNSVIQKELGIKAARAIYHGGTIVCFPGDLSLCEIKWGKSEFAPKVMDAFEEFSHERGFDAVRDGNDILVGDRKVASWARAMARNGYCLSVVHFSISSDEELIRRICTKPMVKLPGALGEYGVFADDILGMLEARNLIPEGV